MNLKTDQVEQKFQAIMVCNYNVPPNHKEVALQYPQEFWMPDKAILPKAELEIVHYSQCILGLPPSVFCSIL